MSRQLSLYLLIGAVAGIGVLFFHVIQPFLVALFLAVVLAVLFRPLYDYLRRHFGGHSRMAAAATVVIVLVLVLAPISGVLLLAGSQLLDFGQDAVAWFETDRAKLASPLKEVERTAMGAKLKNIYDRLPEQQQQQLQQVTTRLSDGVAAEIYDRTRGLLGGVLGFLISFVVMLFAFYYFLADGPLFLGAVHRFAPVSAEEEHALTERFQNVCRGVVLGTVASGLAQSVLAGAAYAVLGIDHLWMLIVLTMFFSFIPFLGAGSVCTAVTLALFLNDQYFAGTMMGLYSAVVVATSDNVVRAYVIGNQAKLHPLVALVTVLGALKLIGLWGIFVGPMVAAFLYALLDILHHRFVEDGRDDGPLPAGENYRESVSNAEARLANSP